MIKKGAVVRIYSRDDGWIQLDYPDLTKVRYKGVVIGRSPTADFINTFGEKIKAYKVRLDRERNTRIFYEDEMEKIK